ncbi:arginine--tRNA ligase [Candidatus Kaiserbacteria bacterium]|nr:arginine--tRNA ligase [Candidatus Kaiserbacteria bacterium]
MQERIRKAITEALETLGMSGVDFSVEHPGELEHGDYASNVAMVVAKQAGENPRECALRILAELEKHKPAEVEKVEIAGPGFINFHLSRTFFSDQVKEVLDKRDDWGKNNTLAGKRVMVEYTDPNPFKVFHIGHLMTNIIGESIACLSEFGGAEVKRANYYGDVGIHIAKAIWGMLETKSQMPKDDAPLAVKTKYLGDAYALGSKRFDEDKAVGEEIKTLNKKIYERSDEAINALYDAGKQWSLDHFETIYQTLGTRFDFYFPESEVGGLGQEVVRKNLGPIFEESDGAVVFHAEKHDDKLHTRVFLNSQGLPTYEAKELALAKIKYDHYPYDLSVIVTANEIEVYFKVLIAAMNLVFPELAPKTLHKPHGMLRLPTGKMSSRTGNIITGESLLNDSIALAESKMQEAGRNLGDEREKVAVTVGVGALKYAILKQAIGKNIIYDAEKSFSFEGDSGPYLQYTHARIASILRKAEAEGVVPSATIAPGGISTVEHVLNRFSFAIKRAQTEYEPHYVVTYLTELAGAFNSWYAQEQIVNKEDKYSPYKVAVAQAVAQTLKNGLWCLGIKAPEKM